MFTTELGSRKVPVIVLYCFLGTEWIKVAFAEHIIQEACEDCCFDGAWVVLLISGAQYIPA